jgi:hypothetical protein
VVDTGRDLDRMRDYTAGRLSDEERRMFEERLVRDPGLVREVEQSVRFQEGLRQLQAQGYVAKGAARAGGLRVWLPAVAAAAVAALALFIWVQPRGEPAGVLRASVQAGSAGASAAAVAARFTFVSLRGDSTPDLQLPASGVIEFRAAPAMRAADATYRVTLTQGSERTATPLGTLTKLALGADGYLRFYADAAGLVAGKYVLRIDSGPKATASPEQFAFTLRSPTGP